MPKPKPSYRSRLKNCWQAGLWQKVLLIIIGLLVLFVAYMYAIAQWYIHTEKSKPLTYGVTFIPDYARNLGVEPKETLDELLGIGVKHLRLVSYWDNIERTEGQYNFDELDWQFEKAEAAGAKVSLSLGLRQPRWPECHMPDWARKQTPNVWQPRLEKFITATVERYKDSPALESYQVENEFFLRGFGICEEIPGALNRDRLVAEYNLVKHLDPNHTAIINRSNNALGWPAGDPKPDLYGISIYKRVWSPVVGRYMEYPIPGWYYGFLAGFQKIFLDRDMVIHELQAEAWAPRGKELKNISLDEQNKSLNARRLEARFGYGEATGMRTMDLWGAEYWYYRLKVLDDPSLWNVVEKKFGEQKNR